ncbi:hypothetical protein [Mesorhizobium sp. M0041]|uniref:hypothetical protein n=1 Tax=Mesorhizobium sp. M0041 TaxID=2956856 RepID=UPI003335AEEC
MESFDCGRIVHLSEFTSHVARWLRMIAEKPQIVRCSPISELLGILLIEMSLNHAISREEFLKLLIEWSGLQGDLRVKEERGVVTVSSCARLHRRGFKIHVSLEGPAYEIDFDAWVADHSHRSI